MVGAGGAVVVGAFYLGHAAGNEVLRAAITPLDWLIVSPAGDFDNQGARHRGGSSHRPGAGMIAACLS